MGPAAWVVVLSGLLSAEPAEAEPNAPRSIVQPATAVIPSATDDTRQANPPTPLANSVTEPVHAPIAISSRRKRTDDADSSPPPRTSSLAWWTTTGLGLAAVLAVLFIGTRLIRRVAPGSFAGETGGPVHLLYRTFLTPKHSVCLVKCGERILLVGVSGERMQTLSEIHNPEEIDYLRGQLMQVRPRSASQAFRDAATGADAQTDKLDVKISGSSPTFADRLAVLRERISEWKSKAKAT